MNKKELLTLRCTAPEWMQRKAAEYQGDTFLLRRKFGEIRTYEFYFAKDVKNGDHIPELIIFRKKNDWINYHPKEERWTIGKFENISMPMVKDNRGYHATYWVVDQYKILRNLRKWQDKIGERRLRLRKRKEREKVEKIMSKVPDLPEDFMNFIENDLMLNANYIIYSRKENKAYCTKCNEEYSVDLLEMRNVEKTGHLKNHQCCPACGVWVKQISAGMSKNKKGFRQGCEIMQPYGSGAIVREFEVLRDFENQNMVTRVHEIHRYIALPGSLRKYEKEGKIWKDKTITNFRYYGPSEGKNYSEEIAWIEQTEIGWTGLGKMAEKIVKSQIYREGMERVLKKIMEKPYVEQLAKGGLKEIAVRELKEGYSPYSLEEEATALTKLLKINKEQLRLLRKQKKQSEALELIQNANSAGIIINEEILENMLKQKISSYRMKKLADTKLKTEKVLRYIAVQNVDLGDFLDHMDMMKKLNIPHKKSNIYPKEFDKFHQEEIEEDILKHNKISKETNEKFRETYKNWERLIKEHKITVKSENYQIVFPNNAADIKAEGRIQHHCVGGYMERAAKGQCLIFYVRSLPEQRLYTAEYTGRKLIQIRAKYNKDPEKEARALAEQFTKELAEAEAKEESKK